MWNVDLVGEMIRLERARRVREVERRTLLGALRRRRERAPVVGPITALPDAPSCADCAEAA